MRSVLRFIAPFSGGREASAAGAARRLAGGSSASGRVSRVGARRPSLELEILLDQAALVHVPVVAVWVARLALDQVALRCAALRPAGTDERRRVQRIVHR